MEEKRLAVLIDADNVGSQDIKTVMDEAINEGVITYKRIYGDWTNPTIKPWKDVLLEYSITPVQQYAYTKGKNSTDSAMIIDAMDILYDGKVDGFCIVSSDSDFTRLATRLRESGMLVIGMGKKQTPKPFVSACNKFRFLDLIRQQSEKPAAAESAQKSKGRPKKEIASKKTESSETPIDEIREYILGIIDECSDKDGWVLSSIIGSKLQNKYSDFDVRNYKFKKLVDFLASLDFEINYFQDPNNVKNPTGYVVFVRKKQ